MKNICNGWDLKSYPHINFAPNEEFSEEKRAWQGCPSVAVTKRGRLFSAWFSGGDFEPCIYNYNLLNISDDGGETWTGPIVTVGTDYTKRIRNIDAELWITKENHLWFMWINATYCESAREASIKEVIAGVKQDYQSEYISTEVMVCKDPDADVLVWEKPRILCDGFTRNKPIETESGKIIVPAYSYSGNTYTLRISTDGGESFFTREAKGKIDKEAFDEICVYERDPGVLRFLARTVRSGYLESVSYDDGDSWSDAVKYEDAPSSRCYIGRLKNGKTAYVRNISDEKRNGMKICLSEDGGSTFPWQMILDERELVSYPDLAEDENGNIYVIYDRERDNRQKLNRETGISEAAKEILLAKITIEDIKNGVMSAVSFTKMIVSKAKINTI